jgi:hypothetical protein
MTDVRPPAFPSGPPEWAPGWHPDPQGRHEFRYWDGTRWSDHVADRGVATVEPIDHWSGLAPPGPVGRPKRRHRRRRRTGLWITIGVLLLLVGVAGGLFAYAVSQVDGSGTFARELDEPGSTLVHTVRAPDDTVVLIRVSTPDGGFDAVIGVSTDEATVDRLAAFFDSDGALPDDVFPGVVPDDTVLLAVSDAAEAGEDEMTFVATPFGGDLEVLVTGAGDTVGRFELEIAIEPFAGPADGQAYLEELAGQEFLEEFEPPRSPIEDILDEFIEEN